VSRILISFARLIIPLFLDLPSAHCFLEKPSGKRLSKLMISIEKKSGKGKITNDELRPMQWKIGR
jgi:hypothetical protein